MTESPKELDTSSAQVAMSCRVKTLATSGCPLPFSTGICAIAGKRSAFTSHVAKTLRQLFAGKKVLVWL